MVDDDGDMEVEREEIINPIVKVNYEAKLKELLHKITNIEIKLCSDGTKEFMKLLKGVDGGELLRQYVRGSSKCSELLEVWKFRRGKPGMQYIVKLVSAILGHPEGKYKPNDKEWMTVSRVLDKFSRLLIEEYTGDVYKELNSKEAKRQCAALLLMASIVRRGSGLASKVAKNFDFKLGEFMKLGVYKKKRNEERRKQSMRKSFVGFAMSFLEVGNPGLLRWILQQKEMYSGVLRGLGHDDDETVVYVLLTLQDRVLVEQSMVPPGLRSVIFGSVTLEQLIDISGRGGGPTAELAYNVLLKVCTDPNNGLMPDLKRQPSPLRGNPKRIMGLMKKLQATEIGYHRDLLLAIVKGRPSFGSAYLEEFPYNIEDYLSPSWLAAISLAADLISSVGTGLSFGFLNYQSYDQPSFDGADMQSIMKCLFPRPFSRSMINKGLLHSDFLVKHGTLRFLFEVLKLLDYLVGALNHGSFSSNESMQHLSSLKQEIQNEARTSLPDSQVLLTLLSSVGGRSREHKPCAKRMAAIETYDENRGNNMKKLKMSTVDADIDIVVGGISSAQDVELTRGNGKDVGTHTIDDLDNAKDLTNVLVEIWGFDLCSIPVTTLEDAGIYFHTKLIDALKLYLRTMPAVLEGSFEFFMGILNNPLELPSSLQISLLSLLIQYIGLCPKSGIPTRAPPLMYKHLQTFIKMLIFSPINDIRDHAYNLVKTAMFSTGAFDKNSREIRGWLLFLPGYDRNKSSISDLEVEVLKNLSPVVISFLCDAISTLGNNLIRYWDKLKGYIHSLKDVKDVSPNFSPLIICILEKFLRLLHTKSGTWKLPEKSIVSLYLCNTLKYLLQTQVDAGLFSALIDTVLSERIDGHYDFRELFCDWRSLKNLLFFSRSISHKQAYCIFSSYEESVPPDSSFRRTLGEVEKLLSSGDGGEMAGLTTAFIFSIICAATDGVLTDLPSVMSISHRLLGVPFTVLSSIFFIEDRFFTSVPKFWPAMFFTGVGMAVSLLNCDSKKNDDTGTYGLPLHIEQITYNQDFDAVKADATAFSFFLKQTPFHVLFPAIMSAIGTPLEHCKIQELLLGKLSECSTDFCHISNLRLVLFWIWQIQLCYNSNPPLELEELCKICVILVENLLAQLLVPKSDSDCSINCEFCSSSQNIQEVAETIFCHPAVVMSLSFPLGGSMDFWKGDIGHSLDAVIVLTRQRAHELNHQVLNILTTTLDYFWSIWNTHLSVSRASVSAYKQLLKAFDSLIGRLFMQVKDKFEQCIRTKDVEPLFPELYTLHALSKFISPFRLLELVDWMFHTVEVVEANDITVWRSCKTSALSVGCCIATAAFNMLSNYLLLPIIERVPYDLFCEMDEKNVKANIIGKIYSRVIKFAITFESDFADNCLLEAVNAVYRQKHLQHQNFHPFALALWMIIMITPEEMVSHCLHRINMKRAKYIFLLIELSSLHSSIFGHLFLGILNESSQHEYDLVEGTDHLTLSEDHSIMLLPASLSSFNSISMRFGKDYFKDFKSLSSFYARILLKGFHQWKSFVSRDIFEEEFGESWPSSTQELLCLIDCSLLGKSVHILWYQFTFGGDSMKVKKRLKLFDSIFPHSSSHDELLDCDSCEMDRFSLKQSLNVIKRIVLKISLCRMLLFPRETDKDLKEVPSEMESCKIKSSRARFLSILVDIWQCIVKKYAVVSTRSGQRNISSLYNHLEVFISTNILELTLMMCNDLIQLQSIPFLEKLLKSALRYRFEDPATLKMLQVFFILLREGKLSCSLYLNMLLAHSQFASTILSVPKFSGSSHVGSLSKLASSILGSVAIPSTDQNNIVGKPDCETTGPSQKQLEIVKLLRILIQLKAHQCSFDPQNDNDINLKELHSLLLCSYGATLSEFDLEIYKLMQEIEYMNESLSQHVREMDFLWGAAALKVLGERGLEQDASATIMVDSEAIDECRRSQFRETLPVDPKMCVSTVLYFPYDRSACDKPLSVLEVQPDNIKEMLEAHSSHAELRKQYDPAFILRFSINSLSMGFIEPLEFASLGLLAVSFVSMSSPDDVIRKLAYDTLEIFKRALEACQKRKDVMQLRLLLTSLQNSIEEPWQRIPSVVSLFAAEVSFVALDPSHVHYEALSTLLKRSSRLNMKVVPLFHEFFWSTSINFKAERVWMLRLVYAGLNSDDDARIYIRNSILETLMNFYVSPLSDKESKELILQVVKKSVKLHKTAHYLVKRCGLFSWLSSLISTSRGRLNGDEKRIFLMQVVVILQVVNDVISSRNITTWLETCALEQLVELSSQLYNFILGDVNLIKEIVALVDPLLQTLILTLKISQKRKTYKPHFTLSLEGLYQIYQVVDACNSATICVNPVFALEAILMSTPPVSLFYMCPEKFSKFLTWAISTALQSDSAKRFLSKDTHLYFTRNSGEEPTEDSLVSKLLRWLTASIIIGKLSWKSNNVLPEFSEPLNLRTLHSLLEHIKDTSDQKNANIIGCKKLAAIIFYLHQLLGTNCRMLSSVVSALCLLLFGASSSAECGSDLLHAHEDLVRPLCMRIRCPAEANPSWRWSFYQPWEDLSLEVTDARVMDEQHACLTLLVIISNVLVDEKTLEIQSLSPLDIEKSGVFRWEKSFLETESQHMINNRT
ncbi:Nucleolar pre-ribosomal-associated protein 1 [Quillaja saponaria]|nr:Nucleolar pre-ribosomal-associated protein 1 [Quillaja saponaria]